MTVLEWISRQWIAGRANIVERWIQTTGCTRCSRLDRGHTGKGEPRARNALLAHPNECGVHCSRRINECSWYAQDETIAALDIGLCPVPHLRWVTAFPALKTLVAFGCELSAATGVEK